MDAYRGSPGRDAGLISKQLAWPSVPQIEQRAPAQGHGENSAPGATSIPLLRRTKAPSMTRGRDSSCEHDAPGITFRYPGRENIRDAKPTPAETFRGRAVSALVFLKALLRAAGAGRCASVLLGVRGPRRVVTPSVRGRRGGHFPSRRRRHSAWGGRSTGGITCARICSRARRVLVGILHIALLGLIGPASAADRRPVPVRVCNSRPRASRQELSRGISFVAPPLAVFTRYVASTTQRLSRPDSSIEGAARR